MKLLIYIILFSLPLICGKVKAEEASDKLFADSLLAIVDAQADDSLSYDMCKRLFVEHRYRPGSIRLARRIMQMAQLENDSLKEEMGHFYYVTYHVLQHNLDSAEVSLERMKEFARRSGRFERYIWAYSLLLDQEVVEGNFEQALGKALQLERLAEEKNTLRGALFAKMVKANCYRFLEQADKAQESYEEILSCHPQSFSQNLVCLTCLAEILTERGEYESSLEKIKRAEHLVDSVAHRSETMRRMMCPNQFRVQLMYTDVYYAMNDAERMRVRLDSAECYLAENNLPGNANLYRRALVKYYCMRGEWGRAIERVDSVVEFEMQENVSLALDDAYWRGEIYLNRGDSAQALALIDRAISRKDSLYRVYDEKQLATVQANYRMKQALLESQRNDNYLRLTIICGVLLVLLVAGYFLAQMLKLNRRLKHNRRKTALAYRLAEDANRLKEAFVKNISYEIRGPLSSVVGFSQILNSSNGLDRKEFATYAEIIRRNSDMLMALVNNILELSRLESGMMRYEQEPCDIVELIGGVVQEVCEDEENHSRIYFQSELEYCRVMADASKLKALIKSVLFQQTEKIYTQDICLKFKVADGGLTAELEVQGSPLIGTVVGDAQLAIRNQINTYIMKHFKGNYITDIEKGVLRLTFTVTELRRKEYFS